MNSPRHQRRKRVSVDLLRNAHTELLTLVVISPPLIDDATDDNDIDNAIRSRPPQQRSSDALKRRQNHGEPSGFFRRSWKQLAQSTKSSFQRSSFRRNSNNAKDILLEEAFYNLAAMRATLPPPQSTNNGRQPQPPRSSVLYFGNDDELAVQARNSAERSAKALEQTVARLIQSIGEMVCTAMVQDTPPRAWRQDDRDKNDDQANASLRGDPVFEYFCETALLTLLVDIVRDKPYALEQQQQRPRHGMFRGVVWMANVKSEALRTVSRLVASLRDFSALHYVLSQHCINELISSVQPLSQWMHPALDALLPPYVDLLKHLALVLADSPQLFCFFTIEEPILDTTDGDKEEKQQRPAEEHKHTDNNNPVESSTQTQIICPLLTATVDTGISGYAESNSFVHATCLNLLVDLMQIPDPTIQSFVNQHAQQEQLFLAHHMCDLLLQRHGHMANLCTGPVVDSVRSNAMAVQLQGLNDQLDVLNDVFDCGITSLNVRLCELILDRVVCVLWRNVVFGDAPLSSSPATSALPSSQPSPQTFLDVGMRDGDVIPGREALMQVALFLLATLFHRLRYRPLARMLAIALFHPKSTTLFHYSQQQTNGGRSNAQKEADASGHCEEDEGDVSIIANLNYRFTPALHQIAKSSNEQGSIGSEFVDNMFRAQVLKAVSGAFGAWFASGAAILLEQMMESPCLDAETLSTLQILLPHSAALDESIGKFLSLDGRGQRHTLQSEASTVAMECVSSLAMHFLKMSIGATCFRDETNPPPDIRTVVVDSRTFSGLQKAHAMFFQRTLSVDSDGAGGNNRSDLFVDHFEYAVLKLYKQITLLASLSSSEMKKSSLRRSSSSKVYAYQLSQHGCVFHGAKAECLVRKLWNDTSKSGVAESRWNAQMTLHFRASVRVVNRFVHKAQSLLSTSSTTENNKPRKMPRLELLDEADQLHEIIFTLGTRHTIGTDIDLPGRSSFALSAGSNPDAFASASSSNSDVSDDVEKLRKLNEGLGADVMSNLLVLDDLDLFLVRPLPTSRDDPSLFRGRILCCVPLLHVIAAAVDGNWIHIAVRHDNVSSWIKNGNIALRFETPETSTTVLEELEILRRSHRKETARKLQDLLNVNEGGASSNRSDTPTHNTPDIADIEVQNSLEDISLNKDG